MVTFAVLIPTYKQHEFLKHAVLSVLSQTVETDVIIVTVHEDRETHQYMDEIFGINHHVLWKIVEKPSVFGQLNTAVKSALKLGRDYMMFMGSDDYLLPNKIRQEAFIAETYKAKIVYSPFFVSDEFLNIRQHIALPNPPTYDLLVRRSFIPDMALVHRSVFEEFGLFDESQGEQVAIYDKWLHVMENYPEKIIYSPFPNYIYRKHGGQTSVKVSLRIEDRVRVQRESLERIRNRNKEET